MTYIDCPVPINNLGLSKIVDFGQVQPLRRGKKNSLVVIVLSMNYVRIQTAISWSPGTRVSYPLDHVVFQSIVNVFAIGVSVKNVNVNYKVLNVNNV